MTSLYQYAIGSSLGSMDYLFNIGIKNPPLQSFRRYSVSVQTLQGMVLGQGWSIDTWFYAFLSDPERAVFKTICPGLSAEVYIRTYNDSLATPAWEVYRSIMLWTQDAEDRENDFRMRISFVFRLLEKIS